MKREIRQLTVALAEAEQAAREAICEGRIEDAEAAMQTVRSLKQRIGWAEELGADESVLTGTNISAGESRDRAELASAYGNVFLKAVRNRRLNSEELSLVHSYEKEFGIRADVMHGGGATGHNDGDVSLVVPVDVQTRINELMREMNDLSEYVRVERVATRSGSRVLELDEDMIPFQTVEEYAAIGVSDNPKFTTVAYELKKRAGILPLTSELLADTDQNILAYVTDWLARKGVVTKNTLILNVLSQLPPKTMTDLDAIKHALNVTLDPAIARRSTILTNQSGYHWLDTQKDETGRYLLQDDITRPGQKMLWGRPVAVVSNRYLPNADNAAPIFIGNLKQAVVLFTTGLFEIASTRVGGEAWRRDSTELRVISRDDVRLWDSAAVIRGRLTIGV